MSKYSKGGFKMTYSKDCRFLSFKKKTDMFRAEQILLCSIRHYKVTPFSWITCLDIGTNNILFFIPANDLRFLQANRFLDGLKKAWTASGFTVVNSTNEKFMTDDKKTVDSIVFHLQVTG